MELTALINAVVITMNETNRIYDPGVVIINGDIIVAVGGNEILHRFDDYKTVDLQGSIIMPGMINGHTHVSMVAFRSLADDKNNRLKEYIFPLEKKFVNNELVFNAAQYGIAEMLLGGVTTFVDMYYFEGQVAHAADQMGIRAILGQTVVDFKAPDTSDAYGGIELGLSFIEHWHSHPRIIPAIAPHAPYSLDSEHLALCASIARSHNIPVITHLAEMAFETELIKNKYNMSPVAYLQSLDLLSPHLIAAHCINVSDNDIKALAEADVGVIHNIGANAKGAKGVAPILKMKQNGIRLGLGSDGAMSGNTLDILTQMPLVAKIHKLFNNDRSVLPARDVIEMATIGGARALHLEETIGSIEVGKKADLVVIETQSINMQPIYDYYSVIVYSANPSNVQHVIVNGKWLVKDKKLINCQLETLQDNLRKINNRVSEHLLE